MRLGQFIMVLAGIAIFATPVTAQFKSEGFEFLEAVKDRDGDAVTDLLNQPGNTLVNTRDITTGETAMHIVVQRRDAMWIKFLAQRGANPNIEDKRGVAPIQIASQLGFIEGVEALLKAGANVDNANDAGETPLISAVHRRDIAMIRLLVAEGADPDRNDNSGRSARDYATLMSSSSQILGELERAEKEKGEKQQTYGPSA